jgi:hypothetical protein
MNIYEALKTIPPKKRAYFCWKFNLGYDQTKEPKSVQKFLNSVGHKTLNSFKAWEKTDEYRQLVSLFLEMKFDNDLQEIYDSLAEKAKQGDEKSIRLLMQLGKEIKQYANEAKKQIESKYNDDMDDDSLLTG